MANPSVGGHGGGGNAPYTDPELRERLKAEIFAGDRGGRPGQWSARKAQLLAREYVEAGGGYTTDKAHESAAARSLDEWTAEEWTTRDGSGLARHGQETARYLPRDAWEQLSPEEAEATDARKRQASRRGQQFVANTPAARAAGAEIRERPDAPPLPGYDGLTVAEVRQRVADLDAPALRRVLAYERAHRGRTTLVAHLVRTVEKAPGG